MPKIAGWDLLINPDEKERETARKLFVESQRNPKTHPRNETWDTEIIRPFLAEGVAYQLLEFALSDLIDGKPHVRLPLNKKFEPIWSMTFDNRQPVVSVIDSKALKLRAPTGLKLQKILQSHVMPMLQDTISGISGYDKPHPQVQSWAARCVGNFATDLTTKRGHAATPRWDYQQACEQFDQIIEDFGLLTKPKFGKRVDPNIQMDSINVALPVWCPRVCCRQYEVTDNRCLPCPSRMQHPTVGQRDEEERKWIEDDGHIVGERLRNSGLMPEPPALIRSLERTVPIEKNPSSGPWHGLPAGRSPGSTNYTGPACEAVALTL